MNLALEATIQNELENLLASRIIFPIKYFEWVENLVSVRKMNGDIRLCIEFCALNKASVKDNFHFPNMELILQPVVGSQMISLLEGFSGYNNIKVKNSDRYKTTFTTRWGTFTYERMPFVLINAGTTFQHAMHIAFASLPQ